ncbi:ATP-binding cassette sub- A member 5 [Halocaridina rubra]|uniref:ATP-binding cassette sub- A member 5 n=1 Tax=Halocaridina rubra TaxID=373956 RepID=A0AAN8WN65_HALRR
MEMSRNGVSPHSSAWESQEYGSGISDVNITGKGAFFPQYKALIIRNITLKIRERRKTLTEFIMPIYFMVILVILRLVIPDNTYPQILTPHGQSDLDSSVLFLQGQALHVTPNNTQIRTIMNEVHFLAKSEGSNIEMYYYETEDDLIHQFVQNQSSITYGVVFSDEPLEDMNYTLRLDPLKTFIPSASNRWTGGQECRQTDPNKGLSVLCAPSGYFYSGFLAIQLLIDTSIIRLTSGIDVPLPSVTLQHFPRDKYTDGGTVALRSIIPLYMVFAWAQFIVYMLMLVVEEKEKKIKESMKMMGLRDSVYWLSWFSIYGTYVLILAIISILILPLGKVLEHANVFLLFILFILYGCSSIMFSFMLTPFFNKAKVAGIAGNLIQVLFSLLYYIQVFVGDDVNSTVYWAMGLLSPCAFSLAIDKVLVLDLDGSGLNFDNMWKGPGLPFAGSLIMISLDIVIYFTLAFYLDNVVPSDYGTKKKPWFIFQKSFWIKEDKDLKLISLSSEDNMGYEEDNITQNSDIEAVASEFRGKIAVRMRHLKKTFHARGKEPIHAVDGISLDIYEDQITAILGHNGAGKTTLFNILTGMTAPTSGSASIFGLDISNTNDLTTIHRITGICPQHDILFMTLTPREHLSFFARIRGIQPENVEDEVQKTLKEVDLLSKADTKGADLSGGQKRKLSIGIALIGDPKIIFLDEPTAGVDAYSRRHLWSLLRNRKKGKVILLTTHFMDEADILADRKAIVSHGRLRCCGSSLFLKNKFGLGYHLT